MIPIQTLASDEIGILVVSGGLVIAILVVITNTIKTTSRVRQVEQSRREIAAYVAEGSITPQDAAKILEAGRMPAGKDRAAADA